MLRSHLLKTPYSKSFPRHTLRSSLKFRNCLLSYSLIPTRLSSKRLNFGGYILQLLSQPHYTIRQQSTTHHAAQHFSSIPVKTAKLKSPSLKPSKQSTIFSYHLRTSQIYSAYICVAPGVLVQKYTPKCVWGEVETNKLTIWRPACCFTITVRKFRIGSGWQGCDTKHSLYTRLTERTHESKAPNIACELLSYTTSLAPLQQSQNYFSSI